MKARYLIPIIVIGATGFAVWNVSRPSSANSEDDEAATDKSTQVQLGLISRKTIRETISTFGTIVPQPGKTVAINLPFETVIKHILVTRGQALQPGDVLIQVDASPAAKLQFRQAQLAKETADRDLDQTEKEFAIKLATNKDLTQAQKAARDADLTLQSLQQQGVNTIRELQANSAGFVDKVNIQDGQIVAPGNPLLELVGNGDLEVKLGVRWDTVSRVQAGERVTLYADSSSVAEPLDGQIRLVTHEVDPATGLVEVFVAVHPGSQLLIGSYVRGEIEVQARDTLVVPKSAVLPEDNDFSVFTVTGDKAVKHTVQLGIQNPSEVEVVSSELKPGEQVVTSGNYELTDGAAVEINAKR
jgi:RND family efflux transporter MFP subunit